MENQIFLSHYSDDKKLAEVISNTISRTSLQQIKVWFSSDSSASGGISPGSVWSESIRRNLKESKAVLVLLTPKSLDRGWLFFEAGFGAANSEMEVIPICLGINSFEDIPFPLALYECYLLNDYDSYKIFIQKLLEIFNVKFDEEMAQTVIDNAITDINESLSSENYKSLKEQKYKGQHQLQEFQTAIVGDWWQNIKPAAPSALSFVEIRPDIITNTVRINGKAYGLDGKLSAVWETVATALNFNERKAFYYWKGWHPSKPEEPFEGIGVIQFHESDKYINSGVGFFSDMNLTDMKSTTKMSVEFQRCKQEESQIMRQGDINENSKLILQKLDQVK